MPTINQLELVKHKNELNEVVHEVLARTQHPDLVPTYKEVCDHLDSAGITLETSMNNLADLMFNAANSGTRLRATKVALDMRKIDRNQDKVESSLTINFNFETGSDNKIQNIFSPRPRSS